jgi:hypothetical protein
MVAQMPAEERPLPWVIAALGLILIAAIFVGSIGVDILIGLVSIGIIGGLAAILVPVFMLGRWSSKHMRSPRSSRSSHSSWWDW